MSLLEAGSAHRVVLYVTAGNRVYPESGAMSLLETGSTHRVELCHCWRHSMLLGQVHYFCKKRVIHII